MREKATSRYLGGKQRWRVTARGRAQADGSPLRERGQGARERPQGKKGHRAKGQVPGAAAAPKMAVKSNTCQGEVKHVSGNARGSDGDVKHEDRRPSADGVPCARDPTPQLELHCSVTTRQRRRRRQRR